MPRYRIYILAIVALAGLVPGLNTVAREDYFRPAVGEVISTEAGLERVVATNEGGLNVYKENGDLVDGFPLFVDNEIVASSPLLVDMTGDVAREIVIVTRDADNAYNLRVYTGGGTPIASALLPAALYYDPAELRVPGLTKRDIILALVDGRVISYRYQTGSISATTILSAGEAVGIAVPSIGQEIAVNYPLKSKIVMYARSGSTWVVGKTITTPSPVIFPVAYGDSDTLYAVTNSDLLALNKISGLALNGFPKNIGATPLDSPLIAEVDSDNAGSEIVVPTSLGKSVVFNSQGVALENAFAKTSFVDNGGLGATTEEKGVISAVKDYALVVYQKVEVTVASLYSQIKAVVLGQPAGSRLAVVSALDGSEIINGSGYNFGLVAVKNNETASFRIENKGSENLNLTGSVPVSITGIDASQFSVITQPPALLAPGVSATFTIRFSPTATGTKAAELNISSNDQTENPFILSLTGEAGSQEIFLYEDGEDGTTSGWDILWPQLPANGTVTNVLDTPDHGRAIKIANPGMQGQDFRLGREDGSPWNNTEAKVLSFDLKTTQETYIYALVDTDQGSKYLLYSFAYRPGQINNYTSINLSPALKDGAWHTITRDLQADINSLGSTAVITNVKYFAVSGYALLDNIMLKRSSNLFQISGQVLDETGKGVTGLLVKASPNTVYATTDANGRYQFALPNGNYIVTPAPDNFTFTPESSSAALNNSHVSTINFTGQSVDVALYEDAEDGSTTGWGLLWSHLPANGTVTNVADTSDHGRVIKIDNPVLQGQDFKLGREDGSVFGNSQAKTLEFDLKTANEMYIYARVDTNLGERYLMYSFDFKAGQFGNYTSINLSKQLQGGAWNTVTRDLQADLNAYESGVTLIRTNYFIVSGRGLLDNIKLRRTSNLQLVTGTVVDNTGKGVPGFKVRIMPEGAYATTNRNGRFQFSVPNGSHTVEVKNENFVFDLNTLPANVNNSAINNLKFTGTPSDVALYEDAEDGTTSGWGILWSHLPANGTVTNVADTPEHGRAIKIANPGMQGQDFRLGRDDGSVLANAQAKVLEFDLKTAGEMYIYARVDTNLGERYVLYSFGFKTGQFDNYTSINLNTGLKDGSWHTITRNLETDLNTFQTGATINSVNYFIVSGYGLLDNIKLKRVAQ